MNHLTDRRQTSKLDQFVNVQCSVVINNYTISIHNTAHIYKESWANSDMPLFRGRPLHYVDASKTSEQFVEISYTWIRLSIADITFV